MKSHKVLLLQIPKLIEFNILMDFLCDVFFCLLIESLCSKILEPNDDSMYNVSPFKIIPQTKLYLSEVYRFCFVENHPKKKQHNFGNISKFNASLCEEK